VTDPTHRGGSEFRAFAHAWRAGYEEAGGDPEQVADGLISGAWTHYLDNHRPLSVMESRESGAQQSATLPETIV
jgi:hypothetical protein